jgi:release factor glutamine methyltransferase
MKIKEVLDKTIQFFRDKKMDQARLEAEWLIGAGLGLDRVQLYLKFDQPLKETEVVQLREMIRRRTQGEPLAYITGTKGFYGFDFKVNASVLIPRPETETLVEKALEYASQLENEKVNILDLGCGSGCIGLTLAKKIPNAKVTLVDISSQALQVAQANAEKLAVGDKVELIESDAALFLKANTAGTFNIVVSNPPYIAPQDTNVASDVKKFEPHLALYAKDGTSLLKTWSEGAARLLSGRGFMLMEMGFDQGQEMKEHFESLKIFERVDILKDLSQHDRVIVGHKGSVDHG